MWKLDKWIDNKIVQNIFIWCCFFLVLMSITTSGNILLTAFYVILGLAPVIYSNNYFVLPFFSKNTLRFLLLFFSNLFVFNSIILYIMMKSLGKDFELRFFFSLLGALFLAVTFGMTLRMARDSFHCREQEKEAELKLLKAELKPHFLFNTLNNLYGLSVIKSDKLPNLMVQLSDLLRYSLYETKEVFVSLDKEINYLENYISLERIRIEAQIEIDFLTKGNTKGKQIAPMLLIVFVENAFKYLGKGQNKKNSVTVLIEVSENTLKFICKNSCDIPILKEEGLKKEKGGIGLVNAKKILELIYPKTHHLSIKKDNDFFLVELMIIL